MKNLQFICFLLLFSCSETNIDPLAVQEDLPELSTLVTFESDIEAINLKYCFRCHNPERTEGGLLLTNFEEVRNSYKDGRSINRILDGSMPPNGAVTPEEIQLILKWREDGFLENE